VIAEEHVQAARPQQQEDHRFAHHFDDRVQKPWPSRRGSSLGPSRSSFRRASASVRPVNWLGPDPLAAALDVVTAGLPPPWLGSVKRSFGEAGKCTS